MRQRTKQQQKHEKKHHTITYMQRCPACVAFQCNRLSRLSSAVKRQQTKQKQQKNTNNKTKNKQNNKLTCSVAFRLRRLPVQSPQSLELGGHPRLGCNWVRGEDGM
jgi:hypothetical protein